MLLHGPTSLLHLLGRAVEKAAIYAGCSNVAAVQKGFIYELVWPKAKSQWLPFCHLCPVACDMVPEVATKMAAATNSAT